MKKLIAFVLALSSLALLVCACAQKEDNKNGDDVKVEEKRWLDNLPEDLDLGGADIKFIISDADGQTLSERSIYVEEDDGDIVNSAIYNRNKSIEDRLNCTITLLEARQDGIQGAVTPSLMAGDDDYDVLGGRQHDDIDICLEGYCLNLNDLAEHGGDYIEVNQPWWGTEYIDRMTYKNQLYWLTGVLSLRYISGANCIFVNAELYKKYVADQFGDVYELVKSGDWTVDVMGKMAALSYVDDNGSDKPDQGDTFGFYVNVGSDVPDALAYAYGIRYSYEDADGTIVFNLSDRNADFISFANVMTDIYKSEYSCRLEGIKFEDGNLLFRTGRIQYAELDYREMQQDFYVIPLPKKDASAEYATTIHDGNLLFAISYCTPQVAATAAVLEAMAAESYRTVMPAYYDMALKYKYTRDDNAADMMDIIRNSVTTDFGFIWGRTIGCLYFTRGQFTGGVTSNLKKAQGGWFTNFDKLVDEFEQMEAKDA